MKFSKIIIALLVASSLGGCANWIFRIDVPQGNFLEQKDIDKLRVGMSKEQVIFVLGRPVMRDTFDKDTWYYVYEIKRGMKKNGEDFRKELMLDFDGNELIALNGDFDKPENFETPLDEDF